MVSNKLNESLGNLLGGVLGGSAYQQNYSGDLQNASRFQSYTSTAFIPGYFWQASANFGGLSPVSESLAEKFTRAIESLKYGLGKKYEIDIEEFWWNFELDYEFKL